MKYKARALALQEELELERRRFKAKNTIYAIAFMTVVAILTAWLLTYLFDTFKIAHASDVLNSYKIASLVEYRANLVDENTKLRELAARSLKSETPTVTKELVRLAIHRYFPQDQWAMAEKVSSCESGMNNLSVNTKNKDGSVDRGLFQINSIHANRFESMYGVPWTIGAHDIDLSVKYARFLWDHSSWNPWVCSRIIHV